jgi:hypothetical protein
LRSRSAEIQPRFLALAATALWFMNGPGILAAQQLADSGSFTISLTASDSVVQQPVGRGLFLRVDEVHHARVSHFGWWVRVVRGTHPAPGETLLLPPLPPHGPHPSDILAWSARDQYFPDERAFDVANQPLEIIARLHDYGTAADSTAAWFTRGWLDVSWRWHGKARASARSPAHPGAAP